MVDGSPYRSQAGDSYLGLIAKVLMEYPRQVAVRCANPIHGVPRETKFLPTVADVVAWCERETEPLRRDVAREQRVIEQIAAREEWQNEPKDQRLLDKTRAWLDRSDPVAAELTARDEAAERARREIAVANLERANHAAFERECRAAGIDPSRQVSPGLLNSIGAAR